MSQVILIAFAITLLVVAVQGAAVPADDQEVGSTTRAACIKETGATEDIVKKASKGEFTDDGKLKCYLKCVMERFQLIENDKIKIEAIEQALPQYIIEEESKKIEGCRGITGTDVCDLVYNFKKCIFQQNPENFILLEDMARVSR